MGGDGSQALLVNTPLGNHAAGFVGSYRDFIVAPYHQIDPFRAQPPGAGLDCLKKGLSDPFSPVCLVDDNEIAYHL